MQILKLVLFEVGVSLIDAAHRHYHLIAAEHVVLMVLLMRRLLRVLLLVSVFIYLWIVVVIHLILLTHVLLLTLHRLRDNSLCIKVGSEVLQTFNFEFENLGAVKVFIVNSELLLYLQLY